MSARSDKSNSVVVVGGEARVSLLPPEIEARKRAAATRRAAIIFVFVAVLIAAVGTGIAWLYQSDRNRNLDAARLETTALLQQQAQYSDVSAAAAVVQSVDDARAQVAATEVDWQAYLWQAILALPPGTRINNIQVDTSTYMMIYQDPTAPLQPGRMGSVSFVVSGPGIRDIKNWALALSEVPGYADARPISIKWDGTKVVYVGTVVLTFDEGALLHRFDAETTDPEAEPVGEGESTEETDPSPSATPQPSGTPTPAASSGTED